MFKGRNPACLSLILAGGQDKTSGKHPMSEIITVSDMGKQSQKYGKRAHNRLKPKVLSFNGHKRRPHPIEEAKRRCENLYNSPASRPMGKMFFNSSRFNKSGSFRQMRSEMRENIKLVKQCLFEHLCLTTMQFGQIIPGSFNHFGIYFICKKTDLSYSTVHRVLTVLENSGYITVKERREKKPDGTFRSIPAIIYAHPSIFHDLDMSDDDICRESQKYLEAIRRDEERQRKFAEYQRKKEERITQIKNERALAKKQKSYPEPTHSYGSYTDYTGSAQRDYANHQKTISSEGSIHLKSILSKLGIKKPPH